MRRFLVRFLMWAKCQHSDAFPVARITNLGQIKRDCCSKSNFHVMKSKWGRHLKKNSLKKIYKFHRIKVFSFKGKKKKKNDMKFWRFHVVGRILLEVAAIRMSKFGIPFWLISFARFPRIRTTFYRDAFMVCISLLFIRRFLILILVWRSLSTQFLDAVDYYYNSHRKNP